MARNINKDRISAFLCYGRIVSAICPMSNKIRLFFFFIWTYPAGYLYTNFALSYSIYFCSVSLYIPTSRQQKYIRQLLSQ
jgi:hypothetical protein